MKFSIRDLFLVTVVVAVCLAWWLDHRRFSEANMRQMNDLNVLEGKLLKAEDSAEEAWRILNHSTPPLNK